MDLVKRNRIFINTNYPNTGDRSISFTDFKKWYTSWEKLLPSWMVYYYVAKDTRSIEHPYSNLVLETFLRARWSETDDDSWSLETLNDRGIHNYSQKKEKSAVCIFDARSYRSAVITLTRAMKTTNLPCPLIHKYQQETREDKGTNRRKKSIKNTR